MTRLPNHAKDFGIYKSKWCISYSEREGYFSATLTAFNKQIIYKFDKNSPPLVWLKQTPPLLLSSPGLTMLGEVGLIRLII